MDPHPTPDLFELVRYVAHTSIGKRSVDLQLKGLLLSHCYICTTQEVIHCDKSDLPSFQLRDGLKEIICFVPSDTDGSFRFPAVPNGKFKVVSIFHIVPNDSFTLSKTDSGTDSDSCPMQI